MMMKENLRSKSGNVHEILSAILKLEVILPRCNFHINMKLGQKYLNSGSMVLRSVSNPGFSIHPYGRQNITLIINHWYSVIVIFENLFCTSSDRPCVFNRIFLMNLQTMLEIQFYIELYLHVYVKTLGYNSDKLNSLWLSGFWVNEIWSSLAWWHQACTKVE